MKILTSQIKYLQLFIVITLTSSIVLASTTKLDSDTNAKTELQVNLNTERPLSKTHNEPKEDIESSASSVSSAQLAEIPLPDDQANVDQTAAPSVTSVHQVWTSSSSGSLDELSPEIISKMRNDVPFLAAYALRPRLVGASAANDQQQSIGTVQPMESYINQLQLPSISKSKVPTNSELVMQTGASSPQKSQSLVPRLGDFNEFNVETSSTSKSEHHHKRKTILKKKGDDELSLKKRVVVSASQLIKKNKKKKKSKKKDNENRPINNGPKTGKNRQHKRQKDSAPNRPNSGSGKIKGALMRSQMRTSQLRRKLNRGNLQHHLNIIRHGRYLQEQSISPTGDQLEMDVDAKSIGDRFRTQNGDQDGVKGRSSSSAGGSKKPFYSRAAQPEKGDDEEEPEDRYQSVNGLSNDSSVSEDGELEVQTEPKRVGDDDVEKDGDTVTVVPKSDGVDDDPEIGEGDEGAPEENSQDDRGPLFVSGEREDSKTTSDTERTETSKPKSRRVNNERSDEGNGLRRDDNVTIDSAGGGGIGVTIGGRRGASDMDNSGGNSRTSHSNEGEDSLSRDDEGNELKMTGRRKVSPGVEFTRDDENFNDSNNDRNEDEGERFNDNGETTGSNGGFSSSRETKDESERDSTDSSASGRGEFDSRKSSSRHNDQSDETNDGQRKGRKSSARKDFSPSLIPVGRNEDEEVNDDVDYRDELAAEGERKKHRHQEDISEKRKMEKEKDCENGSYNHHDDHHSDHHNHHDSIKWLQDAIPGEPSDDYPILSRVNSTNFNCMDQKYPGYYADLESRCQVFHICQVDGRQDSFLCPNGTIFSQITTVCVWWNSFNCEDAPKYYELNALLYKTHAISSNKDSSENSLASNLRPLDEAHIRQREESGGGDSEEEESSIDSLIKAMRRSKEAMRHTEQVKSRLSMLDSDANGGDISRNGTGGKRTVAMMNNIGADNEATIQRKSTNDIPEDSLSFVRSSSRLRGNAEPRRIRRASVRQSPPKLKSRRVSRNSRKRKLRHGIKPKRRA